MWSSRRPIRHDDGPLAARVGQPERRSPLLPDGEKLAQGQRPQGVTVTDTIRLGRMLAFEKPSGGVRGIVAEDIVRRLVSRTKTQQLSTALETANAPHHCAMLTRAGSECVAHALQAHTEMDPPGHVRLH